MLSAVALITAIHACKLVTVQSLDWNFTDVNNGFFVVGLVINS